MAIDRDALLAGGGMAMLLTGSKLAALSMFARGAFGLERRWREQHPDVPRTWEARWAEAVRFYEQTHQHPTNRTLHRIGIPMIVGGLGALLVGRPFRPLWTLGALSFSAGWALNFIGHGFYERRAPAFQDDPLSFLAGPVWDWKQMRGAKVVPVTKTDGASPAMN